MSETARITGPAEPAFRSGTTRAPNLGLGIEQALAKLQERRRAEADGLPPQATPQSPAPDRPLIAERPLAPELPPPDAQMPYGERPAADPPLALAQQDGGAVSVVIDGQVMSVPLDELRRGYLRERDYTQKAQQAAAEMRRAQEAAQQFATARQALEQRLTAALPGQGEFAAPVDWEKLAREDPIGATQKIARLLSVQQVAAEQQQLAQARAQEDLQRKQQMMAAGHEVLCRLIPGWSDAATRGVIQMAIGRHAVELGYPAEQVSRAEVLDPREILMAWQSMNYRRLMEARVQPQPIGARTLNGNGANRRQPQAAGLTELEDRFHQTGHIDDALAVMKARAAARERPDQPQLGRFR